MNRDDCPYCEKERKMGYDYCGHCGKQLRCPLCNTYQSEGAEYCGNCGNQLKCYMCDFHRSDNADYCALCGRFLRVGISAHTGYMPQYMMPPRTEDSSPVRFFGILSMVVTTIFLIIGAVALYVYAADIFLFLSDKMSGLLILIPEPYAFVTLSGQWLQLYWVFLVAVLTLSFIKLGHEVYLCFKKRRSENGESSKIEKTSIYWIGIMWPSAMLLHIAILYISVLFGADFSVPDFDMDQRAVMFLLAEASVWEELITRVLIIGVPLFLVAFMNRKEGSWKFLLGGYGMDKLSMGLIVIAALVFGYGHEAGWGIAKVLPSFLFGLAAGYLFVEYGLHAAILIHFVNDYLSALTWLGGSDALMGLASLGILGVGVITTILLTVKVLGFVKDFKNRPTLPKGLE